MKVEVYGTGCAKCEKLYNLVAKVADENGVEIELEKVSDLVAIMQAGVMTTPALGVDGRVQLAGRLPSENELKKILGV